MAEVILFHHAQGRTAGIGALADQLRGAGHTVHTPDMYDGHTFDTLDDGIAYAKETGFGTVVERGIAAAQELPAEVVYLGISLGVMAAQQLAQNRPGAQGAVLAESCVPPAEFDSSWPDGVPVQVHGMDHDPIFADEGDLEAAKALVADVSDGELFLYPGNQHLFSDSSLSTYDEPAATLFVQRVLDFLAQP